MKSGYDYDIESQIDLQFHEDYLQSQHYLSLGLTPLSQLSPDPVGMSGNGPHEFDYFPSMLPPVSPMTSVMNGTRGGSGISVDDDDEDGSALDSLVMPDAMPGIPFIPEPKRSTGRRSRVDRGEGMIHAFSATRMLEPLVEQRSLEADTGQQDFMNMHSSSSNSDELLETESLIFPAAMDSPNFSRKMAEPSSSHQQEGFDSLFEKPMQNGYGEFRDNISSTALKEQGRSRRQQARDQAKAEQRALLLNGREEPVKTKRFKSRELEKNIARDYATFTESGRMPSSGISALRQEGKFDMSAQHMYKESMHFKDLDDPQNSLAVPVPTRESAFRSFHLHPQQHTRSSRTRQDRSRDSSDLDDISRITDQITAL